MLNLFAGISLGGSVFILLFLLIKPFAKRQYHAKWRYTAWVVLCLLLIIPVQKLLPMLPRIILQVPQNVVAMQEAEATPSVVQTPSAAERTDVAALPEQQAETQGTDKGKPTQAVSVLSILTMVWATGVMGFMLYFIFFYIRFLNKLKKRAQNKPDTKTAALFGQVKAELNITRTIGLAVVTDLPSPMLVGLLHPRIFLPENVEAAAGLDLILRHELTHYKRHDLFGKLLALIANAIHWFNPLMYVMRRQMDIDCELSCDEAVLAGKNINTRANYCETILAVMRTSAKRETALSTYFYSGKGTTKMRFATILDAKKKKAGTIALAVLLIVLLGTCTAFALQGTPRTVSIYGTMKTPSGMSKVITADDSVTFYDGEQVAAGIKVLEYDSGDLDGITTPGMFETTSRVYVDINYLPCVVLSTEYNKASKDSYKQPNQLNHVYVIDTTNRRVIDFYEAALSKYKGTAEKMVKNWVYDPYKDLRLLDSNINPWDGWVKIPVSMSSLIKQQQDVNEGLVDASEYNIGKKIKEFAASTNRGTLTTVDNGYGFGDIVWYYVCMEKNNIAIKFMTALPFNSFNVPAMVAYKEYMPLLKEGVDGLSFEEAKRTAVSTLMKENRSYITTDYERMDQFLSSVENDKQAQIDWVTYYEYKGENVLSLWKRIAFDGNTLTLYNLYKTAEGKYNLYKEASGFEINRLDGVDLVNYQLIGPNSKNIPIHALHAYLGE